MPVNDNTVENLWRDAGLPEYFLGNGGTNHNLYEFVRRCIEAAKVPTTEQPVGCPRSVVLSLKAAMALTKKYLFLVGERKIGDKEITELREAHYQVGNAFDELQRITNRETQREPQEILDEASSIYETWLTDGGFESVRALVNRAYEAGRAPERESVTQWQPIETAPKDGTLVDLCVTHPDWGYYREADCIWHVGYEEKFIPAWYSAGRPVEAMFNSDGIPSIRVTHWMVRPEIPEAIQNEQGRRG